MFVTVQLIHSAFYYLLQSYYLCTSEFHTIVHSILLVSTYIHRYCVYIYGTQLITCINPFAQFPQCSTYFLLLTEMWWKVKI